MFKRYKDKTKTKFSSWEFRAYYPTGKYDRFGKPEVKLKTKAGFKTMKEALDAEREFLNSIDNNNIELNKEITCGWVMDNYIKHLEDEGKAKGTIENYKSLKKYHLSFFVDIKLCNINQDHIDYWENELRTKKKQRGGGKISNYTKYDCVKFLKAAFRYGVKKKKIKVNPFKDIEVTCPSSLPRNRLSTTEVKETIKLCKKELPSYYGLYCIAIMTGMRVGEYSALKVEDIDFRNKTIKVNKQNTRNEYKDILYHMHIHNNFGDDDSHFSITKGSLDCQKIVNTLKHNNLEPIIVFEVFNLNDLKSSLDCFNKCYAYS